MHPGKGILDPFYPPPVCLFRPDTSGEEKRDMVEPGKEGLKVAPDTSVEEGDEEENSGGRGKKTLDSKLSMAPKKNPSSSNLLLPSSLKNGEGEGGALPEMIMLSLSLSFPPKKLSVGCDFYWLRL